MKRVILIIFTTVLILGLTACVGSSGNEQIGIRGEITSVVRNTDGVVASIMVEGKLEADTSVDKASVAISNKTKILKGSTKEKLSADELKEGARVEVVFEGPIAESYPVQGKAKIVRVL